MSDVNKFWEVIETKLGCNVPKYIQNILALNGYDTALSIRTITMEDVQYLENYARNDMKNRIPQDADQKDYYGSFVDNPKEFSFLRGHVKLLQEIVSYIKTMTASKGADFFSVKKIKEQPQGRTFEPPNVLLGKKQCLIKKIVFISPTL